MALIASFAMFTWSISRRAELLRIGRPSGNLLAHLRVRLVGTLRFAFRQEKMDFYRPAGIAHRLLFGGFFVLLLRTLELWGRGFYAPFWFWGFGPTCLLGQTYSFLKDVTVVLVIAGASWFVHSRLVVKPARLTLSGEGLLILAMIVAMMAADLVYDGSTLALSSIGRGLCAGERPVDSAGRCASIAIVTAPFAGQPWNRTWSPWPSPAGSLLAVLFASLPDRALVVVAHTGYWTHVALVLVFLNLLPYSKHFHILTAIPNIFLRSLKPAGRLEPMAASSEELMEKVGKAADAVDPLSHPIGVARIEQFTWKSLLDLYTCTECGRCSDNCPAHRTGKVLNPKEFTLALRDHLYGREEEFVSRSGSERLGADRERSGDAVPGATAGDLVPGVIHPDVLWACTTCRACEDQCPVLISYVDKIVDMRRNLVTIRGEFPHALARPFEGMESNGNPWNMARIDRAEWSEGLDVRTMSNHPAAPVLFWVGCAPSYDHRARQIARSTARLMKKAGVDFAILGEEENCTGDAARRAGNEYLFMKLAKSNMATLGRYRSGGGIRTIVTTCPHCFNTLRNEYPEYGLDADVVHHTDFLLGLVLAGRLVPNKRIDAAVVYHDSCYLGRYNGIYDAPRELLRRIGGLDLVEPEYWTRERGLCCGAGGAQAWMNEQNTNRVSDRRALQLIDALGGLTGGAERRERAISSACPFCMTMLSEGLKSQGAEDRVRQLDVAELLDRACEEDSRVGGQEPGAGGD
jgi:Fe-S oxidoreductase